MKHNKNHDNGPGTGPQLEPVRFEFAHPTATTVCVAGTSNAWHAEAKPLPSQGDGRWLKDTVSPAGTYEYRLVVDGPWIADPRASDSVSNPFRGRNSVLKVVAAA